MSVLVTKANVGELLAAGRLWLGGKRATPIPISPVARELHTDHWEVPFSGSMSNQTTAGAITDDWFYADGTMKPGYLLVDHE